MRGTPPRVDTGGRKLFIVSQGLPLPSLPLLSPLLGQTRFLLSTRVMLLRLVSGKRVVCCSAPVAFLAPGLTHPQQRVLPGTWVRVRWASPWG